MGPINCAPNPVELHVVCICCVNLINQPMLCVNTGHTKYRKAHKLPEGNLCVDSSIKVYPQVFTKTTCFFVCFVALHPKSTAKVMAGRSVHLITLFLGQA